MTTVRYFHNGTNGAGGMTGAPNLSGTAGSMIAVLDACLVDGWGTGTVDSVVISGGIATVTRAGGHPFDVDCVAEIAGATAATGTINGAQKVLTVSGTTYTFATAATGPVTGTITHKVASLGWAKAFSGTNLAAYRSSDVAGTRMYLRVDDTNAQQTRVVGYESMSGISSGLVGPFPTNTQISGGGSWYKSVSADSVARDWVIVGDSRGFVFWERHSGAGQAAATFGFGDFQSNKAADTWACFLAATSSSYLNTTTANDLTFMSPSSTGATQTVFQPRGVSGLGQGAFLAKAAICPVGSSDGVWSGNAGMQFPNPADNGLYVSPVFLSEISPVATFRGVLPGVRFCSMNVGSSVFPSRDRLTGVSGMSGRALRVLTSGAGGPFFIDVTGPWAR